MAKIGTTKFNEKVALAAVKQSRLFMGYNNITLDEVPDGLGGFGQVFSIKVNGLSSGMIIKVPRSDKFSEDSNGSIKKEIDVLTRVSGSRNIVELLDSGSVKVEDFNDYSVNYYIVEELQAITKDGSNDTLSYAEVFSNPNGNNGEYHEHQAYNFILGITQALCDIKAKYEDTDQDSNPSSDKKVETAHRDIKLKNIMYSFDRSGNRVYKLIDFGLFKVTEGSTPRGDTGNGTPLLFAPERLAEITHSKNDIFSLACVIYELLSKKHNKVYDELKIKIEAQNGSFSSNITTDKALKCLYGVDVIDYYSTKSTQSIKPPEEFFDKAHLYGTGGLQKLVRDMMTLNYKERPSAEDVQVEILKLIDDSNESYGLKTEDFSYCSGYKRFMKERNARRSYDHQENHTDTLQIRRNRPDNKQEATDHKQEQKNKQEATDHKQEQKNNQYGHSKKVDFAVGPIVFFFLLIEALVNTTFTLLPLIDYSFYSKLIVMITGDRPYYSTDGAWVILYIIPFIATLLSRLITLPMAWRGFVSLNYKPSVFSVFRKLRIVIIAIAFFMAIGIIVFDMTRINIYSTDYVFGSPVAFLTRRLLEELLTIVFCSWAFLIIYFKEPYLSSIRIKERKRCRYLPIRILSVAVLCLVMIAVTLTPFLKLLWSDSTNAIIEAVDPDFSLAELDEQTYTESGDLTEESKLHSGDQTSITMTVSIIMLLLMAIILVLPLMKIYDAYLNEERTLKRISIVKPQIIYKKDTPPSFRSIWSFIEKNDLEEISVEGFKLSAFDISEIAKVNKNCLTSVSLENNQLEELSEPWNSYQIQSFSCRNNDIDNLSGLRTLSLLRHIDCANNPIEDLDFLRDASNEIKDNLKELDISNTNLTQPVLDATLSDFTNLEKLGMGYQIGINSIEFLRNKSGLTELSIVYADLSDLSPLKGKKLQLLTLASCQIKDISLLGDDILDSVRSIQLDLRDNNISDISALAIKHYKKLLLSYNPLADFSSLRFAEGDMIEISHSGEDDFIDQLDNLTGFSKIIVREVPIEEEGAVNRKLKQICPDYEVYSVNDDTYPFEESYETNTPIEINDCYRLW